MPRNPESPRASEVHWPSLQEKKDLLKDLARFEAESQSSAIDTKMRQAGFEAAGNAASLWNRLNPVNGNNS